jgi:hypothetical protein
MFQLEMQIRYNGSTKNEILLKCYKLVNLIPPYYVIYILALYLNVVCNYYYKYNKDIKDIETTDEAGKD